MNYSFREKRYGKHRCLSIKGCWLLQVLALSVLLSGEAFAVQSSSRIQPQNNSAQPGISIQLSDQSIDGGVAGTQNRLSATQSFANNASGANAERRRASSFGIPDSSLNNPIFAERDDSSTVIVDHSIWDWFLGEYLTVGVGGVHRIHYSAVSQNDFKLLQYYLAQLQMIDVRLLNRAEQLAFWFNLYNAKTVEIVLRNYPIRSIRQVKQKFTDFVGPFDDQGAVNVLGQPLSLNDVESGVIRPVFNDPRIHYALNCASFGCPNLATRAWTGANVDLGLDEAAYQYINSDRAVKVGLFGLKVSKIYKWYEGDFGGGDASVIAHLRQYANLNTLNKLNRRTKISGYYYDWSLNDARINRVRIFESLIR